MKFDPKSSESVFSEKDDDELIRIAYVEETYVSEAKELAKSLLAKRGRPDVNDADIERVRKNLEAQANALEEHSLRSVEAEGEIPQWRKAIREKVHPYRISIRVVALLLMILFWLNSWFEWKLINVSSRRSQTIALVIGLVWLLFAGPTREELMEQRKRNRC
jgi:hypothetical protein